MFKENDEARKEVNLDIWHAAGYDGEGLNILLCDLNGVILPHMKEYCIPVDPENKMLKVPKHNTYTAQVLHEALPKAKIYVAPWTHSSKEISDWLDANPGLIHMANVSLSSPVSDAYDVFKRHNILVCCSSGNDSKRTKYGVSFPADLPWTIAFGAYNWKDKSLYANDVVNYSNGGEDLDAVSCTNIKVQNDKGKLFDYTGTSTASPWGCATLGAYVLWRLKNGFPIPTWKEAKEYIHKTCIDLREKGFDYDSGYGLFVLPKEIPTLRKIEKEIIGMPKVYISPSTQESNRGVSPFGTEEVEMNKIADKLMPLLLTDGRFETKRNLPSMDIYQIAKDSNGFKADIHVAIHSNAGGGEGTEVFAYSPGSNSERLAKCLYYQIAPISPGTDRGIKFNKGLVEVGDSVNATASLIELAFHDNARDAMWMANNFELIAQALYKGICDYFGYDYKALVVTPVVVPPVTFKSLKSRLADDDTYLSVRVREGEVEQAIKDINKLGFAARVIDLA